MKSFSLLPAALAAVALAATTGCMSTPDANVKRIAGGAVPIFHTLDTNNDGKVTYAEFDAGFAEATFSTYNHDATGAITKEEWNEIERANQDQAAGSFRALDLNHDGKLTKEELNTRGPRRNAAVKRIFAGIDKNHDGVLTLEEARSYGIKRAANQDPANHP